MARILIVSSDSSLNDHLKYFLNKVGHNTSICFSRKAAFQEFKLSIIENRTYQIIIVDQCIPEEDGYYIHTQDIGMKLFHDIRTKSRFKGLSIQFIWLTGYEYKPTTTKYVTIKKIINIIPKGTKCIEKLIKKIYELEMKNLKNKFKFLVIKCIPAFILGTIIIIIDIVNGLYFSSFLISITIFIFIGSYFLFILDPSKRYSKLVKIKEYEMEL